MSLDLDKSVTGLLPVQVPSLLTAGSVAEPGPFTY